MQEFDGLHTDTDQGSFEGFASRPIGELLGATKPNASGATSQASKRRRGEGPINPRYIWSDERRAKRAATDAAKRAARLAASGKEETILELKDAPAPDAPAPKPKKEDIEGWAGMLYLGHALMANMIHMPELRLEKSEADELSIASMNVMRHYSTAILSEKSQDWIKCAMVVGAIYVPKFGVANARVRAERKAKQKPPQGMNVAGGFNAAQGVVRDDNIIEMGNE
jgi:hypothetical protein